MTNLSYNKEEIKEQITINDIFDLLNEWGGEPFFQNEELIISKTKLTPGTIDPFQQFQISLNQCLI